MKALLIVLVILLAISVYNSLIDLSHGTHERRINAGWSAINAIIFGALAGFLIYAIFHWV